LLSIVRVALRQKICHIRKHCADIMCHVMWILNGFIISICPYINIYMIDRSVSGLKSTSTPQIGIHWHHYLKSQSDCCLTQTMSAGSLPIIKSVCMYVRLRSTSNPQIHVWFLRRRHLLPQIYVLFSNAQIGIQFSNLCLFLNSQIGI
jgi:hypothetical protein